MRLTHRDYEAPGIPLNACFNLILRPMLNVNLLVVTRIGLIYPHIVSREVASSASDRH